MINIDKKTVADLRLVGTKKPSDRWAFIEVRKNTFYPVDDHVEILK